MCINYVEELLKVFEDYHYSKDEIAVYLMQKYNDAITKQDYELASAIEKLMNELDIDDIKNQIKKQL